jgi:hypothetical protein
MRICATLVAFLYNLSGVFAMTADISRSVIFGRIAAMEESRWFQDRQNGNLNMSFDELERCLRLSQPYAKAG